MFSISRLHQLMQLLPWGAFERSVEKHRADRGCKKFSSHKHLVAMAVAQLSAATSLRQLEDTYNPHRAQHYHLGCGAIRRTTLADANKTRNPQIFADAAAALMEVAGRSIRRERDFMVYLLDSTTILLNGRGFEWTAASATRNQGLKLHLLYASEGCRPVRQSITPVNVNDLDEGKSLPIERGAIYVFDKGYCDYSWWWKYSVAGAVFVTRLKANAALQLKQVRPVEPAHAQVILRDEQASFKYKANRAGHRNEYSGEVRRIEVARPGKPPLVLVTNDLERPAWEIAALYKERWQIELFFKWIKQHLQVKKFLGRSENAVRIQLLVALICYLLVLLYHAKHKIPAPLSRLLTTLQSTLMHRVGPLHAHSERRRSPHELMRERQFLLL